MIGIIGGSGLYRMEGIHPAEVRSVMTPYGAPSDEYRISSIAGRDVIFLPRHGSGHHIPPHKINYRANIWGFKELGVTRLVSVGATGGIRSNLSPGNILIPDQILDFTSGRDATFFHGEEGVVHIDFTEPYCPVLRNLILEAGKKAGIALLGGGTYVCVNGPRLETRSEIKAFSLLGADIVGMTAMPEAVLAREAELCYAGVAVVTNFAAGMTAKKLTAAEVISCMHETDDKIKTLMREMIPLIPATRECACGDTMRDAKVE